MTLYDGKSKRKNVLKVADATFRTSVSIDNKNLRNSMRRHLCQFYIKFIVESISIFQFYVNENNDILR